MDIDLFYEAENPDDLPQLLLLPRKEMLWQNKPLETEDNFWHFLLRENEGDGNTMQAGIS